MCLFINATQEKKFKAKAKNMKWVDGYKVLKLHRQVVRTPYQNKIVNSGWFESNLSDKAISVRIKEFKTASTNRPNALHEGIHFCRTRERARDIKRRSDDRVIVKCRALIKDVFGLGDDDIIAPKIWIPKEELDRVRKTKKRKQKW